MRSSGSALPLLGIYGCGGLGRECLPIMRQIGHLYREVVYIETDPSRDAVGGFRVLSEAEFVSMGEPEGLCFNVAVGDPAGREALATRLLDQGCTPVPLLGKGAVVHPTSTLGKGPLLGVGAYASADSATGAFFHLNVNAYFAHDCFAGDFVTVSPGAQCLGGVRLENRVFVGAGAMIKPGIKVGEGAVIGMGAVVIRDVAPWDVVAGNPAVSIHSRRSHT